MADPLLGLTKLVKKAGEAGGKELLLAHVKRLGEDDLKNVLEGHDHTVQQLKVSDFLPVASLASCHCNSTCLPCRRWLSC